MRCSLPRASSAWRSLRIVTVETREAGGQVDHPHESAVLHQSGDPLLAQLGRDVGVDELARVETHRPSLTGAPTGPGAPPDQLPTPTANTWSAGL